jgi:hypothetical protein
MNPGALLLLALCSWYLGAMILFWYSVLAGKPAAPGKTEGSLILRAGETIVGVAETPHGMDFSIGDYVQDEQYYDP